MKARITFRAEIEIEGANISEIMSKFEDINLFSKEAKEFGADYVETDSIEDSETYEDLTNWEEEEEEDC